MLKDERKKHHYNRYGKGIQKIKIKNTAFENYGQMETNLLEGTCQKTTENIMLKSKILEVFSLKSITESRHSTVTVETIVTNKLPHNLVL